MAAKQQKNPPFDWGGFTWRRMDGGGHLGQEWSADHAYVQANGRLVLLCTGDGISGGVHLLNNSMTYGKVTARFRMTKGCGKYCGLLWPDSGMRPEIDFAESSKFDADRTYLTATLHPDMNNHNNIHSRIRGDYTQWHEAGVEWRADFLSFTLDGKEWFRILKKDHPANWPTQPHHFNFQTAVFGPGTTSKCILDKVTVSK